MAITPNGIVESGAYSYLDDDGNEFYVDPSDAVDWGLPMPNDPSTGVDTNPLYAAEAAQEVTPMPEPMPDERTAGYTPLLQRAAPDFYENANRSVIDQQPEMPGVMVEERPQEVPEGDMQGFGVATPADVPQQPQQGQQPMGMTPEQAETAGRINQAVPIDMRPKVTRHAGRPAGFHPSTRSSTGLDPEREEKRESRLEELEEYRMEQAREQRNTALAFEQRRRAQLRAEEAEDLEKRRALEAKIMQQENGRREMWRKLDEKEQELEGRAADPRRLFNESPIAGWLGALAVGLGAFGAAVTGSRNFALDIINKAINDDIAQQEAEIASDKDAIANRKNAYARELANGADPKFAKQELTVMMKRQRDRFIEQLASQERDKDTQLKYMQDLMEAKKDTAQEEARLDEMYKTAASEQYDRGQAAYTSVESEESVLKRMRARQGQRDVLRTEAGIEGQASDVKLAGAKAGATSAAKGNTKQDPVAAQRAKTATQVIGTSDEMLDQIDVVVKEAGGTFNRETGEIEGADWLALNPIKESEGTTRKRSGLNAIGIGYSSVVNMGRELGEQAKAKLTPDMSLLENTNAKVEAIAKDLIQRRKSAERFISGDAPPKPIQRLRR